MLFVLKSHLLSKGDICATHIPFFLKPSLNTNLNDAVEQHVSLSHESFVPI